MRSSWPAEIAACESCSEAAVNNERSGFAHPLRPGAACSRASIADARCHSSSRPSCNDVGVRPASPGTSACADAASAAPRVRVRLCADDPVLRFGIDLCLGFLQSARALQSRWNRAQCDSVKVGTIFEDSAIGLDKWLCAMWMVGSCRNGVSSYEIKRHLGVTQKSAWFMLHSS